MSILIVLTYFLQMSSSPTSPATPFSPPRSAQTPSAAGSKSFFVENERLRNLDKINEESVNTHVAPDSSIVLDPAPPPRKSFSNESNHKRVDSGNNSLPDLPLPSPPPPVLPKQIIPSPDLPPPPPPVLPKVLRTNSTTSEQSDSSIKGDEYVPSPPPPVLPKRTSVDGSIRNGLTTSDGCSNDRYSLPCHSSRSESQTSSHELPLPPPPVSPKSSLYSTGDFRLGEPELHFPPPPSYSPGISVIDTKETQSTPTAFPSPPPPPPRTFQSAEMSTRM